MFKIYYKYLSNKYNKIIIFYIHTINRFVLNKTIKYLLNLKYTFKIFYIILKI